MIDAVRRYGLRGIALGYLSVIVLVPLAAVVAKGAAGGWHHFWQVAWNREARAALELTFGLAGAIVGRALYEGAFPLSAAVEVVSSRA